MRPVADHIRTLLYEHDYVTVPNFGAFIANYLPSSFNEISGSLMPPQKRIAFNEILKQDDGLLATHIARRESVTIDEAKRKIQSFVTDIKDSLATEKTFSFDKVGSFVLNEENSLVFEPDRKNNFYSESFGFDSLFPRQIAKEKYTYSQNFEDDADELLVHKSSYSSTTARKSNGWTYALYSIPILLLSTGLFVVLFLGPKSSSDTAKSSFNPLDYFPKNEEIVQKVENQTSFAQTEIIKPNFDEKPLITTEFKSEPVKPLSEVEEASKVIETKPEITKSPLKPTFENVVSTINNSNNRYLVVSGVFKSLENVEKLQSILIKNGFSPNVVKLGELSKVVAAEVGSYAEASQLAEKHTKLIGERPAIIKSN
jgi:cell division septation protein DedD/nucleoid DNA-binding protein